MPLKDNRPCTDCHEEPALSGTISEALLSTLGENRRPKKLLESPVLTEFYLIIRIFQIVVV